jgi:hypothetical protein
MQRKSILAVGTGYSRLAPATHHSTSLQTTTEPGPGIKLGRGWQALPKTARSGPFHLFTL